MSVAIEDYPRYANSLKISKWKSQAVSRRTDSIKTKRRTEGQTMIYKLLHRIIKIEQHEPHLRPGYS